MIRCFSIVLFFVVAAGGLAQNNLVFYQDELNRTDPSHKKEGKWMESGHGKISIGWYKNGLKDSVWHLYDSRGNQLEARRYKDGKDISGQKVFILGEEILIEGFAFHDSLKTRFMLHLNVLDEGLSNQSVAECLLNHKPLPAPKKLDSVAIVLSQRLSGSPSSTPFEKDTAFQSGILNPAYCYPKAGREYLITFSKRGYIPRHILLSTVLPIRINEGMPVADISLSNKIMNDGDGELIGLPCKRLVYDPAFVNSFREDTLYTVYVSDRVAELQPVERRELIRRIENNANEEIRGLKALTAKDSLEIDLVKKSEALKEAELTQQKLIRNSVVAGLLVMLGLSAYIYRNYHTKKKANFLLEEQKQEIKRQKELIEEKNRETMDSIYYARRIQQALFASEAQLKEQLPEHFVFFRPKDVVSGDFYWAQKKGSSFYLACSDCTGHGVPGAFMSLLNISFLNEALNTTTLKNPDELLGYVRSRIIDSLKADGSSEGGKDGMDAVLCAYDAGTRKLVTSCAYNPVWIIRREELIQIAPDKYPVGKHDRDREPFTLHEIQLQQGDQVYLFTDGYADQFGGPRGKKFKYSQLKELLLSNTGLSLEEQQQKLCDAFENWKGNLEQVDDVLVIGIRF
ncbi:MAG: SpoIIE family protein phosphatase [Bacteroidia bacterium]